MKLLEHEALQKMVDYSFGDHSGVWGGVPNAYMKKANILNGEFKKAIEEHIGPRMTLYIDNVRLYNRPILYTNWAKTKKISEVDLNCLANFENEDLLNLCSQFPSKKFIIFTGFEDIPLDEHIWSRIPNNVEVIYAADAVIFGGKVQPFPYGLERSMYPGYNHHVILEEYLTDSTEPTKQLYINHRDDTGVRGGIKESFKDKPWATISPRVEYEDYLRAIKDHKFILVASGNGIESTKIWEIFYMRRVPVMLKHPYMEFLLKDFSVLFVDKWSNISEHLLGMSEHLYQQALNIDMDLLDLDKIYNKIIK